MKSPFFTLALTITLALGAFVAMGSFAPMAHAAVSDGRAESSSALDRYTLLAPIPGLYEGSYDCATQGVQSDPNCAQTTLSRYLSGILPFGLAVGGILAVIMFMWGAIAYGINGDKLSAKTEGRAKMSGAIIGLVLLLAGYLILKTINPRLLEFNFAPENTETVNISGYDCPEGQNAPGFTNTTSGVWENCLTTLQKNQLQMLDKEKSDILAKMKSGEISQEEGEKQLQQNFIRRYDIGKANFNTTPKSSAEIAAGGGTVNPTEAYATYSNSLSRLFGQIQQTGKPNPAFQSQMEDLARKEINYFRAQGKPDVAKKFEDEFNRLSGALKNGGMWYNNTLQLP